MVKPSGWKPPLAEPCSSPCPPRSPAKMVSTRSLARRGGRPFSGWRYRSTAGHGCRRRSTGMRKPSSRGRSGRWSGRNLPPPSIPSYPAPSIPRGTSSLRWMIHGSPRSVRIGRATARSRGGFASPSMMRREGDMPYHDPASLHGSVYASVCTKGKGDDRTPEDNAVQEALHPMAGNVQEWTEEVVHVAGTDLTFIQGGSGKPLLVLHEELGYPGWLRLHSALARHRTLHISLHPGFGKSPRVEWVLSMRDLACFYARVLREMHLSPIDVMGFSLGGWLAAEMAANCAHQFQRMVLVAPSGIRPPGGVSMGMFRVTVRT